MERIKEKRYELISKDGIVSDKIKRLCKKAYDKNRAFFNKDSRRFKIVICHAENSFKKEVGKSYFPWAKAYGGNDKVTIRSIKLNDKCYKKYKGTKNILKIITHEINHIFTSQRHITKPYWLFEGIATYVANQKFEDNIGKEKASIVIAYRKLRRKQQIKGSYAVYEKVIKHMIKKYGKNRLIKLFSTYKKNMKKKAFERSFERIYGLKYKNFCIKVAKLF